MFPLVLLLLGLLSINAQIESPVAPPEAVQDRASQLTLHQESTACDHAVGLQPEY